METNESTLSMLGETTLVNRSHPLPLDWVPGTLVDLWSLPQRHFLLQPKAMLMDSRAAEAANALFAKAETDNLQDFAILSAYRDASHQAILYADNRDGSVAMPGSSEHQTGLCMDVGLFRRGFLLDESHVAWLHTHCWEFGFVIRYPEGCEDITGVPYEPWHLRYVGRQAASQIRENGWTLEEWHLYR